MKSHFDQLIDGFAANLIAVVALDPAGDDPGMGFDRRNPEQVREAVETLIDTDDLNNAVKMRVRSLLQVG